MRGTCLFRCLPGLTKQASVETAHLEDTIMAPSATTQISARITRAARSNLHSRRPMALSLAVEVGLAFLRVPVWLHLGIAVVLDIAFHLVGRLL